MTAAYVHTEWYVLLQAACQRMQRKNVAEALGVSAPTLSQVMNGSGKYGTGTVDMSGIERRVLHTFGRYTCPHLTEESGGEVQVVTADQCRRYAHRDAPTGSPRDMQHWQACRNCAHKAAVAPPVPREVIPRGPRVLHPVRDDSALSTDQQPPEEESHALR